MSSLYLVRASGTGHVYYAAQTSHGQRLTLPDVALENAHPALGAARTAGGELVSRARRANHDADAQRTAVKPEPGPTQATTLQDGQFCLCVQVDLRALSADLRFHTDSSHRDADRAAAAKIAARLRAMAEAIDDAVATPRRKPPLPQQQRAPARPPQQAADTAADAPATGAASTKGRQKKPTGPWWAQPCTGAGCECTRQYKFGRRRAGGPWKDDDEYDDAFEDGDEEDWG